MTITAGWNPLQHGAFEYDNLGQSHPLQRVVNSRYAQDPDYREHVHRSLVDPQYALHHLRMRSDKQYANRYMHNPDFRDSVHAKMVDPQFGQHQYRMHTDPEYAKKQPEYAANDDPRAFKSSGPSFMQVLDHLHGRAKWSPNRPTQAPDRPTPGTLGAPLPRGPRQPEPEHEEAFEPFPEPHTPTVRDDGRGNLITARSRR